MAVFQQRATAQGTGLAPGPAQRQGLGPDSKAKALPNSSTSSSSSSSNTITSRLNVRVDTVTTPCNYPPYMYLICTTLLSTPNIYPTPIHPQVRDIISAWGKPSQAPAPAQTQASKGQAKGGYRMENGRLYKLEVKQPQPLKGQLKPLPKLPLKQ